MRPDGKYNVIGAYPLLRTPSFPSLVSLGFFIAVGVTEADRAQPGERLIDGEFFDPGHSSLGKVQGKVMVLPPQGGRLMSLAIFAQNVNITAPSPGMYTLTVNAGSQTVSTEFWVWEPGQHEPPAAPPPAQVRVTVTGNQ